MSTLFDLPHSPSPRLQWLERHGLVLSKLPDGRHEVRLDDENAASGEDAEEAIVKFCVQTGLRHYNQEAM